MLEAPRVRLKSSNMDGRHHPAKSAAVSLPPSDQQVPGRCMFVEERYWWLSNGLKEEPVLVEIRTVPPLDMKVPVRKILELRSIWSSQRDPPQVELPRMELCCHYRNQIQIRAT